MTLRDIRVHLMKDRELQSIGDVPQTKSGKQALQATIDKAVENIMQGKPWNA